MASRIRDGFVSGYCTSMLSYAAGCLVFFIVTVALKKSLP